MPTPQSDDIKTIHRLYIATGYASDDIDLAYTAVGYVRPISQLAYTAIG